MNPTIRVVAVAALLLGAAGCVTSETALLAMNVLNFAEDCTPESGDESFDSRGSLNVAYSTTYDRYIELMSQTGSVSRPGGDPGTSTTSSNANDIIVREVEVSYSGDVTLPNETYPVYFVIQSSGGVAIPLVSFFGSAASQALATAVAPGETKLVNVTIKFNGEYRTGGKVSSNEVVYPITLTNDPCATGTPIATGGCGALGSDTNPVFCGTTTGGADAGTDGGV